MKFSYFYIFLFLATNTFATDWESEFNQLCSYDKEWCGRLKYSDGTWVKPKKEILKLLKELAPTIKVQASKLGVDPRAIAGAIMAENSLNVSISDDVQNLLVKMGVAKKGEILGKKFTFGLGQLNFAAAREAEDYIAKIEKRAPLSDTELSDALLIPEKAIYYVGAVVRKIQDDYKKQGFDISKNPEILATVYNLGKSEQKALESKQNNRMPRPNYFGFFVKKYNSDLAFLAPNQQIKVTAPAPRKIAATPASAKPSSVTSEKRAEDKKIIVTAFTKSQPLYSSPPSCSDRSNYGATNVIEKYKSMKAYPVTTIAEKGSSFKIIQPTIDCESETWQLIELQTGEKGWIKDDLLSKHSGKITISIPSCKKVNDAKCSQSIETSAKSSFLTKENGLLFLKPASSGKPDFKAIDWNCNGKVNTTPYGQGMGMQQNVGFQKPSDIPKPPLVREQTHILVELKNIQTKLNDKIIEIESHFKSLVNNPMNPYSFLNLGDTKTQLEKCIYKQEYKLGACQLNQNKIDVILHSMPLRKLSFDEMQFLSRNITTLVSPAPLLTLEAIKNQNQNNMQAYGMDFSMLNSQYMLKKGEEEEWTHIDLERSLNFCEDSLEKLKDKINNKEGLDQNTKTEMLAKADNIKFNLKNGLLGLLSTINSHDDVRRTEELAAIKPYLIQYMKVCIGMMDIYDVTHPKLAEINPSNDYSCYHKDLTIMDQGYSQLMSKELVREVMFTPAQLQVYEMQFGVALPIYLFQGFYNTPQAITQNDEKDLAPSYCPNKTAEEIENLLKENPCIKNVYVPDEWLLNRLNEFSPKVIKRNFEENDRYAIDTEEVKCAP